MGSTTANSGKLGVGEPQRGGGRRRTLCRMVQPSPFLLSTPASQSWARVRLPPPLLQVVILACLFPLAPWWVRVATVYVLMGLLCAILSLLVVRYACFALVWAATGNSFWVFPNLLSEQVRGSQEEGGRRAVRCLRRERPPLPIRPRPASAAVSGCPQCLEGRQRARQQGAWLGLMIVLP